MLEYWEEIRFIQMHQTFQHENISRLLVYHSVVETNCMLTVINVVLDDKNQRYPKSNRRPAEK